MSAGAEYAGDADPYRKPGEDDETDDSRRMTQKHTDARRPCHRRQAVGLHFARRRRQDARDRQDPPRRPRRHPRPDGDGRPRPRRREGHQAPRPPRADREGVPGHDPARAEHPHGRRRGRDHLVRRRLRGHPRRHRRRDRQADRRHHAGAVQGQRHQDRRRALLQAGARAARSSRSRPARSPSPPSRCTTSGTPSPRTARPSSTWSCRSSAPPAPTSGPSPATWAPTSASAGISRPCAAPAWARTSWTRRRTLDQLQQELTVMPIAEAADGRVPALGRGRPAGQAAHQRRTAGHARRVRGRRRGGRLRPRGPLPGAGRGAARARPRAWPSSADGRPGDRCLPVERRSRGPAAAAPRSPLGSPTPRVYPAVPVHSPVRAGARSEPGERKGARSPSDLSR